MEKNLVKFHERRGNPMTTITHVAETVQRIIGEEAEQLAREVGFLKRKRVLSGADFVQSLILGWLQEPEITLDGLTQVLERREVSISASGLSQRFTPEAATLLHRVLERLSAEQRPRGAGGDCPAQAVQRHDPGREFDHHLACQ